jgi:hypothetical protein
MTITREQITGEWLKERAYRYSCAVGKLGRKKLGAPLSERCKAPVSTTMKLPICSNNSMPKCVASGRANKPMPTNVIKYQYRGVQVMIGQSPDYNLWRVSLDGEQIANTFFATALSANTHCKSIIDARGTPTITNE